jgi:hypothetical protein
MIETGLRAWKSYEDVRMVIDLPITEGVPYIADWQVGFGEVLEFFGASLNIRDAIGKQNEGKTIDMRGTRRHAIVLKEMVNKAGLKCGYVDLVFAETMSNKEMYACAINAFPIEGNGTVYFSPSVRCLFTKQPEKGMSFGEMYIKKCKVIW